MPKKRTPLAAPDPDDDAQSGPDSHGSAGAVVGPSGAGDVQGHDDSQRTHGVARPAVDRLDWLRLRAVAETYYDAQLVRIAVGNRVKKLDKMGVQDGALTGHFDDMRRTEKAVGKLMVSIYHDAASDSICDWQESTPGIGAHMLARLLGHLGHPVLATPMHWEGEGARRALVADDPFLRRLRDLWAYCGHGDTNLGRRAKGMTVDEVMAGGRPELKMILHLIAESAIKCPRRRWTPELGGHWAAPGEPDDMDLDEGDVQHGDDSQKGSGVALVDQSGGDVQCGSDSQSVLGVASVVWPFRLVYESARDTYADRTHADECRRCGPKGKPAQVGSPWSEGHKHAAALRLVGKEILRSLWRAGLADFAEATEEKAA